MRKYRYIVNIRGCNGSGKSSIPFSMLDDKSAYIIKKPYEGKQVMILTVFPKYNWVCLGPYQENSKAGGVDYFKNKRLIQKVFWYACKKFPSHNILFEGAIVSSVFQTWCDLLTDAKNKYPESEVFVVNLVPPLEICLKRIAKRNGGKEFNVDRVKTRYKEVERAISKFNKCKKINSVSWNNCKCLQKDKKLIYQLEDILDDYVLPF